jgi:hypothetical protein
VSVSSKSFIASLYYHKYGHLYHVKKKSGRCLRCKWAESHTGQYKIKLLYNYSTIQVTLIASMAYSTWNILPSGENVLTPLYLEHAHDTYHRYPEIVHTTSLYSTRQIYQKFQDMRQIYRHNLPVVFRSGQKHCEQLSPLTRRAPILNLCENCYTLHAVMTTYRAALDQFFGRGARAHGRAIIIFIANYYVINDH